MPKTTKSPAKSPAKPRPTPRTPKKKRASKLFVDDEAEDSDEGELLDPGSEAEEFPAALAAPCPETPRPVDDENPFDDPSRSSPELTPPPTTQAASPRKQLANAASVSPSKGISSQTEAVEDPVIDITPSEEDLEAMDENDSMFRKLSGVKAVALPCPLRTRGASKRSLSDDLPVPSRKTPNKKAKTVQDRSIPAVPATTDMTQFVLLLSMPSSPHVPARFMGDFMSAFLAQHLPAIIAAQSEQSKGAGTSDQSGSTSRAKPTKVVPPSSPDWPPPYGGAGCSASPATPSPSGKDVSTSKLKGKGKAGVKLPAFASAADLDDDDVSAEVSKFMQSPKKPQTMAEYFGGALDADFSADKDKKDADVSTVFLEGIEVYRAYFDASAPCGVFDIDLQDKALRPIYTSLAPLPSDRQIIPVYDPNRIAGIIPQAVKGGRVKYSIWEKYIADMLVDNSMGAITFKESAPNFINPSRVSPVRISSRPSVGSTTTHRLHVNDRIATCVSALFCSESKLVAPAKIGGKSERMRKWLAVFGERLLRAQISTKHTVSFQTMISPDGLSSTKDANDRFDSSAPADMFSPIVSTKATKTPTAPSKFTLSRAKTLLAYNDRVPIYNARKVV
ncbi:hypothetical protein B0H17DRAFT_1218103, partial [Mycena rosella]